MKESSLWACHIDLATPNFLSGNILFGELQDEDRYIQFGQDPASYQFWSWTQSNALELSYNDNFTAGTYKFTSIQISRRSDKLFIHRTSYDFLNFFADIGGLFGVLSSLGFALVGFLEAFIANNKIISLFYIMKHSKQK